MSRVGHSLWILCTVDSSRCTLCSQAVPSLKSDSSNLDLYRTLALALQDEDQVEEKLAAAVLSHGGRAVAAGTPGGEFVKAIVEEVKGSKTSKRSEIQAAREKLLPSVRGSTNTGGGGAQIPKLAILKSLSGEIATEQNEEKSLVEEIVERFVHQTPLMMDLETANPDWNIKFGWKFGSVRDFMGKIFEKETLADAVASNGGAKTSKNAFQKHYKKAVDRARVRSDLTQKYLELRAGRFLCIAAPSAGTNDDVLQVFRNALNAKYYRGAVAALIRQYVHTAPTPEFAAFDTITEDFFHSLHEHQEVALFGLLTCLPFELWHTSVADVVVKAYLKLRKPRRSLVERAAGNKGYQLLMLEMGKRHGVVEWAGQKRAELFGGTAPAAGGGQGKRAAGGGLIPMSIAVKTTPAPSVALKRTRDDAAAGSSPQETPATGPAVPAAKKRKIEDSFAAEQDNTILCTEIARRKGVPLDDVDPVTRVWINPPSDDRIRSLQKTLQGAARRLAADLYAGESHFLLELLQNADDCSFPAGRLPSLQITICDRGSASDFSSFTSFVPSVDVQAVIVAEHCETGFTAKNVAALCDLGQSTKTSKKFIGHKGVGFKSVFKVSSTPVIHSGAFSFHFDSLALEGLGMLVPFPLPALAEDQALQVGVDSLALEGLGMLVPFPLPALAEDQALQVGVDSLALEGLGMLVPFPLPALAEDQALQVREYLLCE